MADAHPAGDDRNLTVFAAEAVEIFSAARDNDIHKIVQLQKLKNKVSIRIIDKLNSVGRQITLCKSPSRQFNQNTV